MCTRPRTMDQYIQSRKTRQTQKRNVWRFAATLMHPKKQHHTHLEGFKHFCATISDRSHGRILNLSLLFVTLCCTDSLVLGPQKRYISYTSASSQSLVLGLVLVLVLVSCLVVWPAHAPEFGHMSLLVKMQTNFPTYQKKKKEKKRK